VGRGASPAHTKAGELVATGRRKAPLRSLSFESAARFTAGRFFRALHFDFCRRDGALCAATGVGPQCAG